MEKISILQTGDIHIKNRDKNLYKSTEKHLFDIASIIKNEQFDCYLIAGDIFDVATPNDSERKLFNKHIGDVLNIPTLKELVVMLGNHDILADKKQIDTNKENNAFDSLHKFIETLTPELASKVTYLKEQKAYESKVNPNLIWIPYSLENGMSNGNMINWNLIDLENQDKYHISIFHDIVRDFVEDTKLPVRKDKLEKLPYIDDFKTELILAGDIHKHYDKTVNSKRFVYCNSSNQVNFGEGSYIKIRKNSTLFDADVKVVKKIELFFEGRNSKYEISDIELPNVISYITIDLNTNKVVENFMEDIEKTLSLCKYGENQTFIKLKLANSYLNHELDIIKLVERISSTKNSITEIMTVYDKFVLTSDGTNINDLEVEGIEIVDNSDANEDKKQLNIDDLKLDTNKLNLIFDKVLTKHVTELTKEIGDDELVKDIVENIKSLFDEQIELSLSSVPNYSTILNWVDTNNFMNLGANKIMLNIPGLTRIKGTNGIGKTTLYNMLRWIIDGVVFEGLKANQKVKNTLLIFNDKQYNLDTVVSRLNCHVNGTNVLLTRSAFRKWKNNATDEIKKSPNWKDYVSEVSSSIKVTVLGKDGVQKDFTGEEAETLIKRWFGNITNTIMILNQQKILSMLNLPADKLQELVLDYIGIDYLKVMKDNLPLIKSQYNLQRPKTKIEDLRIELNNASNTKNDGNNLVDNLITKINDVDKSLFNIEIEIVNNQKERVNIGNIPELIKTAQDNIDTINTNINNFVVKELKEVPVFNEIQPIEPVISSENSVKLSNYTTNIAEDNQIINENEDNILFLREDIYKYCKEISSANDEMIDKNWFDNNFIFQDKQREYQTSFDFSFNQMCDGYKSILESLKVKQTEKNDERLRIINSTNSLKVRIIEIDKEIESGICVTCLRPLDEDFESHKQKLNSEKNEKNDLILLNEKSLTDINSDKLKIDSFVNLYQNYYEKSLTKDINWFETCEPNKAVNVSQISELIELKKQITWYTQLIEKSNAKDLKFFNDFVETNKNNETVLTQLFDNISIFVNDIQIYQENNLELKNFREYVNSKAWEKLHILKNETKNQNIIDFIIKLSKIILLITTASERIDINEKKIQAIKDEFSILRDAYVIELQNYNTLLTNHNNNVNSIIEENKLVHTHNDKFSDYKNTLNQYIIDKNNHEKNQGKYDYLIDESNTLTTNKNNLTTEKNTLSEQKVVIEKELLTIDNNINNLNTEYLNYIEYKKHTYIYGLYDKLINKDFPKMVFEYYRNFLNNTLNILLEDMNFKLYWHQSLDLYMVQIKNGQQTFRPVQLVSGMETAFLGLSLIYAIHLLNIKNSISNLFIDEISGQLNSGKELSTNDNINYQEQLVLLLSKFTDKSIFIIDHVIDNLFETHTYEVVLNENNTAIYKSL